MSLRALVVALCGVCGGCFLSGYELAPRDAGEPLLDAAAPDARPPEDAPRVDASSEPPDSAARTVLDLSGCGAKQWCVLACGGDKQPACDFTCPRDSFCQVLCSGPDGCAGLVCRDATCDLQCRELLSPGGTCGAECNDTSTCLELQGDAWCGGTCEGTPPRDDTT